MTHEKLDNRIRDPHPECQKNDPRIMHRFTQPTKMAGFTLIEVIFYILFVFIVLGGSIATVYYLLSDNYALREGVAVEEEANFIIRKILWIINDINVASIYPIAGESRDFIIINKNNGDSYMLYLNSDIVHLTKTSSTSETFLISGERFIVSSLSFEHTLEGFGPNQSHIIKAGFLINGQKFNLSRYIR